MPTRTLKQALPAAVPVFPPLLPTRVLFDPNRGDLDKINDYTANVYFGEVDIAEADPVIAAAGGVASAGLKVVYGTGTNFDYEAPTSSLTVGPGAKAIGAAVARFNGAASAKALGRIDGNTNLNYNRNAWNGNTATVGTTTVLNRGISAGAYLDRTSGNDNDALLEQPAVNNWAFGH
ncbi:hypothetical protein OEZ85_014187 [Tetradesmus obliquus]|uniref:Uncharacterized protein n=1 Tax=Tetradesmus obliquus TaxID=3088 RepID=A0ABY8U7R4_TETOB|nr:hypothetical protein OEZ85_014187 [Tetradesmus obliquus]